MNQRYFLIEPKYSDPDTFCNFIMGSDRVRASTRLYANLEMLLEVASALETLSLDTEWPPVDPQFLALDYPISDFQLTVLPHEGQTRTLRFNVLQDYLDDGAPFRADIRFDLSPDEATAFATELRAWCAKPEYAFIWKGD